ncbi:MAG: IS1 family transposase [Symbiopectobacterium sp.]|uniref:IS1 family transposase n=1 Tax=Symbiopectobacterium sp. TaxID=2952789 RepID=UPI003F40EAFC
MANVDVRCPFCEQTASVKKHGYGKSGHQRYCCQSCKRTFQLDYSYRACQPGMTDQLIDLVMNNADIHDTARALHISINAVDRLKRLNRKTLGYSKSSEKHDRLIGTYIEREYYV